MNKFLLGFIFLFGISAMHSQKNIWSKSNASANSNLLTKTVHQGQQLLSLDMKQLKAQLNKTPVRTTTNRNRGNIISFPVTRNGDLKNFRIREASIMHPTLATKYPGIRSYVGQGIDDPSSVIRFSVSHLGFKAIVRSGTTASAFIESVSSSNIYAVFTSRDANRLSNFECKVEDEARKVMERGDRETNLGADDGILRTFRLAISVTGEYTQFFGGTVADGLAAVNETMTRVNGITETDFHATMVIVADNDQLIYTNPSTDPYSAGGWNSQLQNNLDSVIGSGNYDIGHLLAVDSGLNGNAGCIGCVCTTGSKGSAFTAGGQAVGPTGMEFDLIVGHEMGHQYGANHTFTIRNEGTNAHFETGSGTTIMSYAGITSADVQSFHDPIYLWFSIDQVINYISSTSCQVETDDGNAVPTVDAGSDVSIPASTPFILTGTASDPDGDTLTYTWEQADENDSAHQFPDPNTTSGVAFRNYPPSTESHRYFPRLETIKEGQTSWTWEALSDVSRDFNFRLTVRDNVAGGGTNNGDDITVTVVGEAGPFVVTSPNLPISWNVGVERTVEWDVAGTDTNGINASEVDILLSTDGGDTYDEVLASNVPNIGSYLITVPDMTGTQNRIMVKASDNVFFDISDNNFSIVPAAECSADNPPGNLVANDVTDTSADLGWDFVDNANYDLEYRESGAIDWISISVENNFYELAGLGFLTAYEVRVRTICPDASVSEFSEIITFTTLEEFLEYCDSQGNDVSDEYIGRVQVGTIDNSSGNENGGYSDFTAISTELVRGDSYDLTVTPVWVGSVFSEGYSVWIDYNRDGDFNDTGEQLFTIDPTQDTSVSGSFTVPANTSDLPTRLRVSMKWSGLPTPCEAFSYGEVEDYTVILIDDGGGDTEAPSVPTNLTAANTTQTSTDLSWDASTDNVGVTSYTIYQDGAVLATVTNGPYPVTGLTASTTYSFTVSASDAAGNESAQSTAVSVTTLDAEDTEAPSVPTNLTASGTTQTTTDLSWDASTDNVGVTGYTVYQDGAVVDTVSGTSYSVTGLTASTTYSFTVSASDAAGNESAQSTAVSVTTLDAEDTEAPSVPTNLTASGTTQTTTDLSWDASTDNVGVTGYTVYQDGAVVDTVSGTSYSVTGLTASTTYSFTVSASDAAGNESAQSTAVSVTTLEEPGGTYCESSSNNTSDEFIGRVQLGDIDNESGPTFYSDFTDLSTVLTKGEDNTITITATWTGFQFSEGYAVWIDYNQDYDFDDEGELVFSQDPINTAPVEGTFVVPQDAVNGPTRMRVSMKFSDIPDPCENFTYGEVEDYTVDISGDITEVISEGYFETGWDGWVDGGSDAFRYAGNRSFEGIRSIRLRDNSGEASSMTLEDVDLSAYDKLNVSFYYYPNSMESGEDFLLQYYDGANWNTVASWVSGTDFTNGSFFSGDVTISDADYAFPADAQIRIQCDAGNNADQVFIDQVIVKGIISEENVGAAVAANRQSASAGTVVVAKRPVQENEYVIYPNPVRENLNYKATLSTQASYIITNIMGQQVRSGKSNGQDGSINVNGLPQGVYIIMFNDGRQVKYYKFIKR